MSIESNHGLEWNYFSSRGKDRPCNSSSERGTEASGALSSMGYFWRRGRIPSTYSASVSLDSSS